VSPRLPEPASPFPWAILRQTIQAPPSVGRSLRRGHDWNGIRAVSETKAPEAPERLHRGALGLVDISASTMANIGPAYSFYFGFAFLVFTAGIAAPLTIVAAGIAIALLGNTLAQFSRVHPSTGGFISFVGKTFGSTSAVTTAPRSSPMNEAPRAVCPV
jgi:hypothetical protein